MCNRQTDSPFYLGAYVCVCMLWLSASKDNMVIHGTMVSVIKQHKLKKQFLVLSFYNRGPVTHQSSLPHIAPCHWEHLDDLELTDNKISKNKLNNMYSNSGHVIVFYFICRKLLSKIWFTLVSVVDITPIVHMYCAKCILQHISIG